MLIGKGSIAPSTLVPIVAILTFWHCNTIESVDHVQVLRIAWFIVVVCYSIFLFSVSFVCFYVSFLFLRALLPDINLMDGWMDGNIVAAFCCGPLRNKLGYCVPKPQHIVDFLYSIVLYCIFCRWPIKMFITIRNHII